jgi:hypothetical protein
MSDISQHPAVKFIGTMFEPSDRLAFMVKEKSATPQHFFVSAAEACRPEFISELTALNNKGADIYLAPNVFKGNRRKKENVEKINALWIDIDRGGREALGKVLATKPEPHIVLESSTDKFQGLWKVDRTLSIPEAEKMLKSLATQFGGDMNATDAPRVLRVPGFKNCKYTPAPEVEVAHESASPIRYPRTAFGVEQNASVQPIAPASLGTVLFDDDAQLDAAIEVIFAKGVQISAGPEGGRNTGLTKVAGEFRNLGLDPEEIEPLLHRYNEQFCVPPFSSSEELQEIHTIAESIGSREIHDKEGLTPTLGGVKCGTAQAVVSSTQATASQDEDPYEVLVAPPSQEFIELLRRSRLAQQSESWLSQHAECPHAMTASADDWLVDRLIRRRGLTIFAAEQGSFKSILALFLSHALMQSNKDPLGSSEFLGRKVCTRFGETDKRPFRIYYIDLDSPKGLTKKNCLRIGLDAESNDGTFKVLGAYSDDPITTMDDPRLVEAAKRERAYFIFDTLSKVFEGLSENDPTEANSIMSKATRLAYASEGVLILHHDAKDGRFGYRGSTPIVAVPDMSFALTREQNENIAVLKDIRFKDVESYQIKFELSFGSRDRLVIDSHYSYKTLFDSLSEADRNVAGLERQHAVTLRNAKDQEFIDKAKVIIETAAASGKPAPSQNSLAKQLGLKGHKVKERILCASTKDDPRPWSIEQTDRGWLVFLPLSKDAQQAPVVVPKAA